MMFSFFLLVCSILSIVAALPLVNPVARDVWVPQIISPNASTIWVAGQTYTVSWNTSAQPTQVTNPNGMVYLRHSGETQSSPIAQGFPLADGQVNVTVPANTNPAEDWIVVLFGDSGNFSPTFTIQTPSSSSPLHL